ncbi:MAG TPA: type II secretion system F family protein [Acidimicrobiales bacterium]|jgi:Flp pilus assembly protein TadB
MIFIAFLGAGTGLGIWLIFHSFSTRERLSDVGATLALPGRSAVSTGSGRRSAMIEKRMVQAGIEMLRAAGMDPSRRAADLKVARRTVDQHVLAKLVGGIGGGVMLTLMGLVFRLGPFALLMGMLGAAAGFFLPELTLTGEAQEARKAFRHAYGAYLDLVNVMLAAGAGPESALHTAADSGSGFAFAALRSALEAARRTRRSMADALSELGAELDISELRELAASVALVGNQGAKVRSSLAAKADTLRAQQVSEAEAEAESATERMTLPVVVMLLGFLLFIAFPAVAKIATVGSGP